LVAVGLGFAVVGGVVASSQDATVTPSVTATTGPLASDRVEVGGLSVEGATIDLGVVPLDVTVTPTWTITNTTNKAISLGEPHASVLAGCCPGPLTLLTTHLDPGASTVLAFPLQMHAGMDGPHDFDVHVPIAGSTEYLTLKVVGLFSG
jgi:hypothetical protein